MGVSKNNGKTPKSSHSNRVFHYFHHPFWGYSIPLFLEGHTHIVHQPATVFSGFDDFGDRDHAREYK